MKPFSILLSALCMVATLQASTVSYTADDSSIFPNPERGFIIMLEGHLTKKAPYAVKGQENTLEKNMSKDHISLVLVHYYLDNFVTTSTLPDEILNAFDTDMQVLRDKGLKAIVRFSYTNKTYENGKGEESAKDATLAIAQSHINQYKSHWQANSDVIFVFQAGFIGAWGEWYYTDNYGNQEGKMNANRRALLDALLDAVPQDRCIQLRTPLFKTGYVGSTSPLNSSEAYKGTAKSRLAHHNDAFLENYGDMGTYTDTAKQKPYIAQETLYVPLGGESCILDEDVVSSNASYAKTTAEMSRLHWTFIQSGYSTVVTNRWREDGTFDELNRKMGYRYQLVKGSYSDQVTTGGTLSVNLQIRNNGYAPLYNERPVFIVLKNNNYSASLKLSSDPRRWLPNGEVVTINEQLKIPTDMPGGTYELYLYLPDAYSSISSNPCYAVRFANKDVWVSSTGMNKLNASVTVSGGEVPPEPTPNAVLLPGTLNKANVSEYSSDMTWFNGNYFNFGPEDGLNTSRWAEWQVELRYPGEYIVSENMATADGTGHSWQLQLCDGETPVSTYVTPGKWDEGKIVYEDKWDLTAVPKGFYKLRVQNVMEWGQPKLQSITLEYDGLIPDGIPEQMADKYSDIPYDILGRPVDDSYKGITIYGGKKILQIQ